MEIWWISQRTDLVLLKCVTDVGEALSQVSRLAAFKPWIKEKVGCVFSPAASIVKEGRAESWEVREEKRNAFSLNLRVAMTQMSTWKTFSYE